MSDQTIILYATFPADKSDVSLANKIAQDLISKRLAACVNILSPMTSVYEWDGAIETSQEVPAIIKTTSANAQNTIDRINQLHPFDVPCIVSLPISEAHSHLPFLDWIKSQTTRDAPVTGRP